MGLDAEILTALRRAGDGFVSGADLSQRLGVTRAAIWARIDDLRKLGYDIAASPHQGYQLLEVPNSLPEYRLCGTQHFTPVPIIAFDL